MIGIFDSGIGGLSLVRQLLKALPEYETAYFGDLGRTPYGNKSLDTVRAYAEEIYDFLGSRGARAIIIACNTASAAAGEHLKAKNGKPVFDVITAGVRGALAATENKRIALMGTASAMKSGKHREALKALAPDAAVFEFSCPALATMIEDPDLDPRAIECAVHGYLRELPATGADTLVLACTHYPLVSDIISRVVGPGVRLVDPAVEAVNDVRAYLAANPDFERTLARGNRHEFFVSDQNDTFNYLVLKFLGKRVEAKLQRM